MKKLLLLLFSFCSVVGYGEEYVYEVGETNPFTSANLKTGDKATLGDFEWILKSDLNYLGFQKNNYFRLSSGDNTATNISLSTEAIPGCIHSVEIVLWSSSIGNKLPASVSVSVGGEEYGTKTIPYAASDEHPVHTFTGSSSGKIEINITQSNKSKGLGIYFFKLKVVYGSTSTVSIDQNDANAKSVILKNMNQTADVSLTRTFAADGGWYTMCLPFGLTSNQLKGTFGSDVRVEMMTDVRKVNGKVTLVFSPVAETEAGRAYLVMPSETAENPLFSNVLIEKEEPVITSVGGYFFTGVFAPTHLDTAEGNYRLLGNGSDGMGIYKVNSGDQSSLLGTRGYFIFPSGETAEAKAMVSVPTGISDGTEFSVKGNEIYTVQGVRVEHTNHLPAGVYVRNGRKVLVK